MDDNDLFARLEKSSQRTPTRPADPLVQARRLEIHVAENRRGAVAAECDRVRELLERLGVHRLREVLVEARLHDGVERITCCSAATGEHGPDACVCDALRQPHCSAVRLDVFKEPELPTRSDDAVELAQG
jgi:hypothetical protein